MTCPRCGADSRVIKTAITDYTIWRRRKCTVCGYRFSTQEVEDDPLIPFRSISRRHKDNAVDISTGDVDSHTQES